MCLTCALDMRWTCPALLQLCNSDFCRVPAFLVISVLQLLITATLADGSAVSFSTAEGSWKSRHGPIVYDHLWHGEIYDSRQEAELWPECGSFLTDISEHADGERRLVAPMLKVSDDASCRDLSDGILGSVPTLGIRRRHAPKCSWKKDPCSANCISALGIPGWNVDRRKSDAPQRWVCVPSADASDPRGGGLSAHQRAQARARQV